MTKRVILNMACSLDGFFSGPNGELDWMSQAADAELTRDLIAFWDGVEGGFVGYTTGMGMIGYWRSVAQDQAAPEASRAIARAVNRLHTILVASKEQQPGDQGEILVAPNDADLLRAVARIKERPGADLAVSGGIRLARTFVRLGIVDEFLLTVHPVALGTGRELFTDRTDLELVSAKTYRSGVVRARYRPADLKAV